MLVGHEVTMTEDFLLISKSNLFGNQHMFTSLILRLQRDI
jgi:hypothetical protein